MTALTLQGELLSIINNMELNLYTGNSSINLLDLFPTLKKGFCYFNTIRDLLRYYSCYHDLIQDGCISPNKWSKKDFQSVSIIKDSSFDMAKFMYNFTPNWDDQNYGNIALTNLILSHGCINIDLSPTLVSSMEQEEKLSMLVAMIYSIKQCKYRLYPFLKSFGPNNNSIVYTSLKKHPKVNNLSVAVMFNQKDKLERLLQTKDPRHDKFQAYILSLKEGDRDITKLLLDGIVIRTLLNKEILLKYFGNISLVRDLYGLISTFF